MHYLISEEICVVEAFDEWDEHNGENFNQPEMDTTDVGLSAGTVEGILDTLDRDITDLDTGEFYTFTLSHIQQICRRRL